MNGAIWCDNDGAILNEISGNFEIELLHNKSKDFILLLKELTDVANNSVEKISKYFKSRP